MKFEYQKDNIILKILDAGYADIVLDFYLRNAASFDIYETEKPDNFYTLSFQKTLLMGEYSNFIHSKSVRFFMFDISNPEYIIGCVSFNEIRQTGFQSCHIGYKIDVSKRRQGYATKMLTLAIQIMEKHYQLHRIEAYIHPENTASIKLIENLGFVSEGICKSYAMLNNQWTDHIRYAYISIYQ